MQRSRAADNTTARPVGQFTRLYSDACQSDIHPKGNTEEIVIRFRRPRPGLNRLYSLQFAGLRPGYHLAPASRAFQLRPAQVEPVSMHIRT